MNQTDTAPQSLTADAVRAALLNHWPMPAEPYPAALRLQELCGRLKELIEAFETEHRALTSRIITDGLKEDGYSLIIPASEAVSIGSLRTARPDIFSELVYLREADVRRFVGRKRLYELARETAGADRVRSYERINVTDLRKVLPPEELALYVRSVSHEHLARVVQCAEE